MARLSLRENAVGEFDNFTGVAFGSIEAADTKTVNGQVFHEVGRFGAQVFKKSTLDDGVKILLGFVVGFGLGGKFLMLANIARKPIVSMAHGAFHHVVVAGVGSLIKSHVNIGANFPLRLHGNFGRHADFVAVDVGFESDAVMVDFDVWQRKHLETAGIGEGWGVPVGEVSETAGLLD